MSVSDIANKLEFICESFIDENLQSELMGKDAATTYTTTNHFMKSMLNYSDFTASIVPASVSVTDSLINQIYLRKGNTNFVSVNYVAPTNGTYPTSPTSTIPSRWKVYDPNDLKNSEYNYSVLLNNITKPTAYGSQFGSPVDLLDILNRIRLAYNILDETAFRDYRSKKEASRTELETPIAKYSIGIQNGVVKSLTENSIATIESAVDPFFKLSDLSPSTNRLEMMRRILYLYDALIHIYLGFYLLIQGASNANYRIILYDIVFSIIQIFVARNDVIEDVGGNIGTIQKDMQKRINQFNGDRLRIEEHAKNLQDYQTGIQVEQGKFNTTKYNQRSSNIVYIIYLVLFIISLIGIGSVVWNSALSSNIKRLIVSLLAGLSIIAMVVLYLVNRYVLEKFAGAITISNDLSESSIFGTTSFESIRNNLMGQVYQSVYQYLTNTLSIGLLITTYNSYGDMNYSIQKEQKFYEDRNLTLLNNKKSIAHASNVIDLESKIKRYRVYYFIQLLIVISLSSILIVYLPEGSSVTSLVLIIASAIIILFTYTYIININNLVRTDATKLYWGQPDTRALIY